MMGIVAGYCMNIQKQCTKGNKRQVHWQKINETAQYLKYN